MKTVTLVAAAIGMLQVTSAQPHRRRNHIHERQHQNAKKDVVVTIVDTVYAEATSVPEVIVYVDGDGKPVSTTTQMVGNANAQAWSTQHGLNPSPPATASTSSTSSSVSIAAVVQSPVVEVQQAAVSVSSSVAAVVAPVETVAAAVAATTYSAEAVKTSSAAPASSSTATSSGSTGFGVSYSPYNADGTCKSQTQVNKDFEALTGYSMVRSYGTDCNQVATILSAAKAHNMKLFAGVFNLASLTSEIATIVSAANGDWSSFHTISIGNELVNSGTTSAAAVVAAVTTAKGLLKAAGYTGNVVTVDTLVAARANPSLCDVSDYCAVNCHPFFDGTYTASQSGKFLTDMTATLSDVLANKNQKIVITETGWPWQGETNGKAVPSLDNQASAISAIKSAYASNPSGVILFTAFNDMWKKNTAYQFEAEQFWGMGGATAPSES